MLQDAHIHFKSAAGYDLDALARILSELPVRRFFFNAACPGDWDRIVSFGRSFRGCIPFLGIHPWFADQALPGWDDKLNGLLQSGCAGIGEIGLDRARSGPDIGLQMPVFIKQLELASKTGRPVVIHAVRSWDAVLKALASFETGGRMPVMIHSFYGSIEVLKQLLEKKCFIGISARVLNKYAGITEIIEKVPLDRILLETDIEAAEADPCLWDEYARDVSGFYAEVARCKSVPLDVLERRVWENGDSFVRGGFCGSF
jgi:TatD DNase family protein